MKRRNLAPAAAQLRTAQNLLRGAKSPRIGLSKARPLVPASEMQNFVRWLPTVRQKGRSVPLDYFPDSIRELWRNSTLAPTSLARELAWASATFCEHADAIERFRTAVDAYETDLVQDRFDECRRQLSEIEADFGSSLWAIETRLALLQRADGLEAQKSYAASVQEARGRNDVVAFLTHNLSRRNEPNTTPVRYVQHLQELTSGWTDADDLTAYLLHRLADQAPRSSRECADVLRYESGAGLVDHYETFVRMAAQVAAGGDAALRAAFLPEVGNVVAQIDDERLRRVAFLLSGDRTWLGAEHLAGFQAENALAVDDLAMSRMGALDELKQFPADASLWSLCARIEASVDEGERGPIPSGLAGQAISQLTRLVSRDDGSDLAMVNLLMMALNHRLHSFSQGIAASIWNEMLGPGTSSSRHQSLAFAYGMGLRPSDISRMPSLELAGTLAETIRSVRSNSPAVVEHCIRSNMSAEGGGSAEAAALPPEALLEAEIARVASCGGHDQVLSLAAGLPEGVERTRRRRVMRSVAHSLLQTDRIIELASLIAESCVTDPALSLMLPLSECAVRLDRELRRKHARDLSIPIVLDLFSKRFDNSLDDVRSYSYEDLLIAHGVERPSQLEGRESDFDQRLLRHYLRHVCIPEVMQVSSIFQGTRELEDERKKVLTLLINLDPVNAKDYETEFRDVTRAQLIHRGVRQVERSKIYVDVPAIKRGFEKKHRETFQRYQALNRAGMGADDGEIGRALEDALTGKPLPQQVLHVPENEASDLLQEMLGWLFEESTSSPEHGLDCYLSMRIRHGTLSGQLRTPLEVEQLITQRAADTDEYEPNEYWSARLAHFDHNARSAVESRLSRFSSDYDALIFRMAGELIQVESAEKPNGLFRTNLKAVRYRIWIAALTDGMSFEEFFESAMELFWESVEHSLAGVRHTIDEALKPEVQRLFAKLERDVQDLAAGTATTDLDRAVRTARTGVMQALDIVKDWFRLSQSISEPVFPIGDLIDVGLQCVTAIHHDFAPEVQKTVDPLPPFAGALTLFSDIFFIIFDNVRRHSGAGPKPRVTVNVSDKGETVHIVSRSVVSAVMRSDEAIERVSTIRQTIAEGDFGRAMRSEGGTGLIKLHKLVNRGQGEAIKQSVDFGFDGNEFYVALDIRKREIERREIAA